MNRLQALKAASRKRREGRCGRCGGAAGEGGLLVLQGRNGGLCATCWTDLAPVGAVRLPLEAQAPLPANEGHEDLRPFNPPHPKEMP